MQANQELVGQKARSRTVSSIRRPKPQTERSPVPDVCICVLRKRKRVAAASRSSAKAPSPEATANRTSSTSWSQCSTRRGAAKRFPIPAQACKAELKTSGSFSCRANFETTENDSSRKAFLGCSTVRLGCASTSAPRARIARPSPDKQASGHRRS
jgi:hypothetical protein